ncbi:hypothetical protein HYR99_32900, partial [Candidatus Poribacteria bacterium]|nr:hypothetical protein [Candidatus Poribacteria bacterium]
MIPIWSAEYFPSQNGPAYLLIIHMFKEFHNPAFNYSDYYELRPFISPYLLFNLIVYLLHFIFSLLISEKIGLSIYAILLPLSVFYFLKIANPGKMYLGFVSFLYIYNFFLFRGYFNFCLAIPIFFFCFGYWLNHKENLTLARIVILNVLAKQIKRRSPIPQMGHEHTPNREAVLMGVDVKINSQGLRDYEYPISKA